MARHLWIYPCALSICCLALALHHAHAHEQLRHAPTEAGDGTDTFDISSSKASRIDKDTELILERRKRNAFNDENYLDESEDGSDLSTDETERYAHFVRVRRETNEDDLGEFETEDDDEVDYRGDRFTRVRRSVEDRDENVFIKNDDRDSEFQESNRDERGFFEEDGLVEQDEDDARSKRSVEDKTRLTFGYQELDDDDGHDDQDDTSNRVFKRFKRSLDDEITFGEDTRSENKQGEKGEKERTFKTKRHVGDMNEETEYESEDGFLRKARATGRFRRTLPRDRSDEIDSAEDNKDDDTSSEERLKRSTADAVKEDDKAVFRLKRGVDNEDLFMNHFNPKPNIRNKREFLHSVADSDSNENTVTSSTSRHRHKRSQQHNFHFFESELGQEVLSRLGETELLRTRTRRSATDKKQAAGGAHQVSSYTAYELKPAATSHKGKSGSGGGSSGHKKGFSAASGHKSGSGHKAGKGFSEDSKGSHDKKGASGHKEAGGKKYAGGEHKSHSYKGGDSGKKGSKSHKKGHSAHKSKGQKQGGFKNKQDKDESGGSKSFYDKSDHKGYHSKYDHFDSFHVSSEGGEKEKGSHASKKTHDNHGTSGHKEAGKHHNDKAAHKGEHGSKGSHEHKKTTNKKASHDSKHEAKH